MQKKIELKGLPKANSVLLSKDFRKDYLDFAKYDVLLEQSTLVTKLIFHIVSDLREHIFYTGGFKGLDNQIKLNFWNEEFLGNDNTEIVRVYNISTFLKNRDKEAMTAALDFVKNFRNEKYTFENSKGQKITTSGGLVKDWFFAENSGNFQIQISTYWANKIVALDYYNEVFMYLFDIFKCNKQLFFCLWVLELKEKGTSVSIDTLQKYFKLNYKNNYDFIRFWLVPLKTKLDQNKLGISFNYCINEKNTNKIDIVNYHLKPELLEDLKVSKNMITYKLSYLKRKYELNGDNIIIVKNLIEKDYYLFESKYKEFIKSCGVKKINAKDFKNNDFVKEIKVLYL